MSGHFWKLSFAKIAPRLRARAIWKSKSLKTDGLGTFFEVQSVFRVAGAGISTRCKIRGRRRSSWGLQKRWQAWWIWRGSEMMHFAWQAQWFCALRCRCSKPSMQNPWKGCKFHGTEVLLCSDHFAWQLQEFVCLGSTFAWQAQYCWSIQLKITKTYWNSDVKCLVDMSFLKEVSQKSFVFELQSFILEGSLAEMLRFWASKLQFWRKSRRKASFLSFKAFIFEGSLAEKLRFWASKFQFWRKSRRNASFLSFKASILKEVSQKSFIFDLQSFVFEGSLAEKLRFWVSKLQLWRKSRTKASFDKIICITHQLTTKSLEPQIIWHPNHLNLKSIDNHITWSSKQQTTKIIWSTHRLTTESLESQIKWQPHHLKFKSTDNQNHLKHTSIDNQITWISNQLTTKSIESQINWQPKSFESQINSQPNHLNLTSLESDINSFSNQLNSARSLPIGSLSLETSATALCGRYVIIYYLLVSISHLPRLWPKIFMTLWLCVKRALWTKAMSLEDSIKWWATRRAGAMWPVSDFPTDGEVSMGSARLKECLLLAKICGIDWQSVYGIANWS